MYTYKMTYTGPSKFNKFQKLEMIHLMFCDYNEMKVKINNKI